MTILQIHLLMLGLGLFVFLFLSGVFSNRKSYSRKLRRQWWMGAFAGIAVAASPLSRFWREPVNNADLLIQSLIVAAICLLALLVFALLRFAFKAIKNRSAKNAESDVQNATTSTQENASTPIVINADGADTDLDITRLAATSEPAVTVDRSGRQSKNQSSNATAKEDNALTLDPITQDKSEQSALAATDHTDSIELNTDADLSNETILGGNKAPDTVNDKDHVLEDDQAKTTKLELEEVESVVNMRANRDTDLQLNDAYRPTSAANDNSGTATQALGVAANADEDNLDLSETEELFAEMRQKNTEVELPDDEELRKAKADTEFDELDLDTQLIQDKPIKSIDETILNDSEQNIEEAEMVDLDETSLEFGNDLTGEYAHPGEASPTINQEIESEALEPTVEVPDTLDDAMLAAKASAGSLRMQVSILEQSIVQLDDLRDATINAQSANSEHQDLLLKQKDSLTRSEHEARQAAESVIAAQSALIEQAKRQQSLVNSLLQDERTRLQSLQREVDRSKKMARTAANLARRAAIAQQEIRDVAKREQTARLKSQESTRKAVTIARNAISALAAEERKRGITRH